MARYGQWTPAARFWRKVNRAGECWEWLGGRVRQGYGIFHIADGVMERAHRAAWALTYGAIPPDCWVLHRCDNPSCVRPSHLFLGDALVNVHDMIVKRRARYRLPSARGEANSQAKLSWEKVAEIRANYKPGLGVTLAARYGVSQGAISHIVTGRNWQ